MHGFSLTLLPLPADSDKAPLSEKDVLRLLDMPANVPGWPSTTGATSLHTASADVAAPQIISESSDYRGSVTAEDSVGFVQAIRRACEALIAAEAEITRMDTIAGDGKVCV
jgi:dihydroxyacetone kinase